MARTFKNTLLATAALAGFASMSPAEEPLKLKPVEPVTIVSVSTRSEASDDDTKRAAVLASLLALSGLGTWALMRKRSLFGEDIKGDRSEDDCWK